MGSGKMLCLFTVKSLRVGVVGVREDEGLGLVWKGSRGDSGEGKSGKQLHCD